MLSYRTRLIAWSGALLLASLPVALAAPEPPPFLGEALAGFSAWDANGDGHLTLEELQKAVASPEVKGAQAAAAVALRRAATRKTHALPLPLTREALTAAAQHSPVGAEVAEEPDGGEKPGAPSLVASYAKAYATIMDSPRDLFVNGVPHVEGFRQAKLGTCFSLAPLAACIVRDPAAVAARFAVTPTGYTVRFGQDRVVAVPALTDGEIAMTSTTGGDGLWASVYEKAVGLYRITYDGKTGLPLDVASKGGSAGTMLSVLTGRAIKRFSCAPWHSGQESPEALNAKLKELRAMLAENVAAHRLATVGAGNKGLKVPSLARMHAYAVLGYDVATDLVTIRDPHGQTFAPKGSPGLTNGYAVSRGVFQAPLGEVVQFMSGFAFTQDTPATASEPKPASTDPGASTD